MPTPTSNPADYWQKLESDNAALQKSLREILEIADDREDINNAGGPNDWMKVATLCRDAGA